MTHQLVVTAMGVDRPGIVSKLARQASDSDCDIVDSRMAIFGNEFTLIMLLEGSWSAITKIESTIPSLSLELELMTVVKRTSRHTPTSYSSRFQISFCGQDNRGTMKAITEFLAEKSMDLATFGSHAEEDSNGKPYQQIDLAVNLPENLDIDSIEDEIQAFAKSLDLSCTLRRMSDSN
ncbi:glycine cleavage system transcriptional repressor [Shewanella sp. 202IG2-18]|uniref:glycine cleavage system protein R n=1 Tax=Parashewanella hymeniacidonis TaxID=2807618 RepID=UPI0019611235|nr:ACT domain-containing protein [Parashewanella hymeniacidonis]MBM7072764.1 glycine cleavage system transcriptional repressor [Parashewanella hymeniacidonis]